MPYKIATWNINSVRLRMPSVTRFVQEHSPDILCLQETKVEDGKFPLLELQALGYPHVAFRGEKSYNGVAILSRVPLGEVHHHDFAATGHTRHISARLPDGIEIHNVYIPAGGDIPDRVQNPKFGMKLDFVDALSEWATERKNKAPMILLGDFNIAPLEHDVWSSKQLRDVVSHTPIEREKLGKLQSTLNWRDSVRKFVPENEKAYSWWSYRAQDWLASNRGRKLDHIWLTPELESKLQSATILKDVRGWVQPSDHVPVVAVVGD